MVVESVCALVRMITWGKTEAPAARRDRMLHFNMAVLGGMAEKPHISARSEREQLAMAIA